MVNYDMIRSCIHECEELSDEDKALVGELLKAKQENRLIVLAAPFGADVWVPCILYCCSDHSRDYISIQKHKFNIRLTDKPVFTDYQKAVEWAKEEYPELPIE